MSDDADASPAAVVLLSGGLDSATLLAMARAEGWRCHALSFSYGQRHEAELQAASRIAARHGAEAHRILDLDLGPGAGFGGSALTDDVEVPRDRDESTMSAGVPPTYVPARNTILLAYALAYAELHEARQIFIGVNAVDYSGYPDCRPAFVEAFERAANLGTRAGIEGEGFRVRAPLVDWPKTRIIEEGLRLGVDYSQTHSCYAPEPDGVGGWRPCGRCDACLLRQRAFEALGRADPVRG